MGHLLEKENKRKLINPKSKQEAIVGADGQKSTDTWKLYHSCDKRKALVLIDIIVYLNSKFRSRVRNCRVCFLSLVSDHIFRVRTEFRRAETGTAGWRTDPSITYYQGRSWRGGAQSTKGKDTAIRGMKSRVVSFCCGSKMSAMTSSFHSYTRCFVFGGGFKCQLYKVFFILKWG